MQGIHLEPDWFSVVRVALAEDRVREDVTSELLGVARARPAEARFIAEERLVLAGLPAIRAVFEELDVSAEITEFAREGSWVEPGSTFAVVRAPAGALLGAERVTLNLLQHLSGVATATRRLVELIAGTGARITHTRKTLPGLRGLEVYAVSIGGGVPNRGSLAGAVLWKDNHWALLPEPGDLAECIARAPAGCEVVVEVETEAQFAAALAAGVRHLLIDNQSPKQMARWAKRAGPGVVIQASGRLTEASVREYAEAGAHLLAVGQITHSVRASVVRCDLI